MIAGAGTGKTNTLAHRVAHLVLEGVPAERILLLTFTRRAAEEPLPIPPIPPDVPLSSYEAAPVPGNTTAPINGRSVRPLQ